MVSKPKIRRVLFLFAPLVVGGSTFIGTSGVSAGSQAVFGVDYYISAPLVQGSYVNGSLETFDSPMPTGACPSSLAGGITLGPSSSCRIDTVQGHGGATGSSASPVVAGAGSQFATTIDASSTITFLMPSPQKYLGFWWSAGNTGNVVTFFSGQTQVLQVSTDEVFDFLGAAPTSTTFGDTGPIISVGGTPYPNHHYFGMPRGYTSISLDQTQWNNNPYTRGFPFLYMHVFSKGGLTFDRVVFSGQGFEFDNMVVSPLSQPVDPSLVLVGSQEGTPPPGFVPEGSGVEPDRVPWLDVAPIESYLEETELPDTGSAPQSIMWLALGALTMGMALTFGSRRIRRS